MKIENVRVEQKTEGLSIMGSLAVLLHGSNPVPLTMNDVSSALEKISEMVGVDVCKANVRRVDVAANLILSRPVPLYLPLLAAYPRANRHDHQSTTRDFHARTFGLQFYDKAAQLMKSPLHSSLCQIA